MHIKTLFDGAGITATRIMNLYFSAGENSAIATKCSLNDETNFREISYIINEMDGKLEDKIIDEYKKHNKIFLLQGGADYSILENDFLSAPLTEANLNPEKFLNKSARHVSGNTAYCATALGLVLRLFSANDIEKIDLLLQKGSTDPEENRHLLHKEIPKQSHHAEDAEHVLHQLKGKIFSSAQKMHWEHYNTAETTVEFKRKIEGAAVEILKDIFRTYPRCIYCNDEIGGENPEKGQKGVEKLLQISGELNIPDGDILLPTYNIKKNDDYSIKISGYNPKKSITALSCLDWLWIAQGRFNSWHDVFAYTNKKIKWHGHRITELKSRFEEKINGHTKEYKMRVSER